MSACVTQADTRRLPLVQERMIIGRNASNDICIPEDSVSGVHARMRHPPKGWVIEDLNSTNGTFVDKVRLKAGIEYLLSNGQTIHLGDYGMRFHATGWDEARTRAAAATPGMPMPAPAAMVPPPPAAGEPTGEGSSGARASADEGPGGRPRTLLAAVAAGALLCLLVGGWLVLRAPGRGPALDAVTAIRSADRAALMAIEAHAAGRPAAERQVIEAAVAVLAAESMPPTPSLAAGTSTDWRAALETLRREWEHRKVAADGAFLRTMMAVETARAGGDREAAGKAVEELRRMAGGTEGELSGTGAADRGAGQPVWGYSGADTGRGHSERGRGRPPRLQESTCL